MSGSTNGRFQEQLEAFEHDRQAFRDVVAQLRTRGDAILEHSAAITDRTDGLVADLEALRADVAQLKDETYRKTGVTLERIESQRTVVEQMVASAADSLDTLRSGTETDLAAIRSGTAADLAALRSGTADDLEALRARTEAEVEALKQDILGIRAALEQRLATLESKATILGSRLDATSDSLLRGSADVSELISRSEAFQTDLAAATEQIGKEARAARQALAQVRSLSQLRWTVAVASMGVGAALCAVSGAFGLTLGNPGLGWAIGAVEAVPWLGIGLWVLWNRSPTS